MIIPLYPDALVILLFALLGVMAVLIMCRPGKGGRR